MEEKGRGSRLLALLVVALVAIVVLSTTLGLVLTRPVGTPSGPTEIPIGLAIAISGGTYVTEGPIRRDAALLAIDHMNEQLTTAGAPIRFKPIHEDSKGNADGAKAALQSLAAAGVKVVVGPLSSGEVSAVKSFVDANKIVVISPSSTSVSLAIPNDYIFRAAATDIPQAKALAQLLSTLGFTKVVVFARNDDYGKGIADLFETQFTQKYGGQVKKLMYSTTATDFSPDVNLLKENVVAFGANAKTAVLIAAFDSDGLAIFNLARQDATLGSGSIRWFGSESLKRPSFLPPSAPGDVGKFLERANLTGYFAQPDANPVTLAFQQAYKAKYGREPSPYSYYTYDAAWMAMQAVLMAGKYDGEAIKSVLPKVAERYIGASGPKLMDANGDLAQTDYRVWKVVSAAGAYSFKEIGIWRFSTEELKFFP